MHSFLREAHRRPMGRGARARIVTLLLGASSLFASFCVPAPARADVGPPVKVFLQPWPNGAYPTEGSLLQTQVEIISGENGVVENFDLVPARRATDGSGWQLMSSSLPDGVEAPVQANVPLVISFEAMVGDPTEAVSFQFRYNGKLYKQDLRMAPLHGGLAKLPGGATAIAVDPANEPAPPVDEPARAPVVDPEEIGPDPNESRPEVAPREGTPPTELSWLEREEDAPVLGKSYTMHITGRFVYYRPDGRKMGADGVTVRVMDEDIDWDDELDAQVTDSNGYFDMSFTYTQSEDPDVYLEFEAKNGEVTVEDSDIWETNYVWTTSVKDDFSGTTINYGELKPSNSSQYPALHIITHITRVWRFFYERGWNPSSIDVLWPDGSTGAYYNPFWEEIHISTERQWREDTIAHEYGHHWVDDFADDDGTDYCNSPERCDSGDDCGHCMWCEETPGDAWQEGYPNWIADAFTRSYTGKYGYAPMNFRDMESIAQCGDVSPAAWDDEYRTEGYIGAVLTDMDDGTQDDDPNAGLGIDQLNLNTADIMAFVDTYHPLTPNAFITTWLATHSSTKEQFWSTLANNRFVLDDNQGPGVAGNFTSTSHAINVESPDRTIDLTWNEPSDNFSGVGSYSIRVGASAQLPDTTSEVNDVTSFTTSTLAAGTYYITLRARDRAGNWASSYATVGPLKIRDPYPADINPYKIAGWGDEIVVRPVADATGTTAPLPTSLDGDTANTYWSVSYRNDGELPTVDSWLQRIFLDGVSLATRTIPSAVPATAVYAWWNQGPLTVRGGRHTVSTMVDDPETHSEQNEDANDYARQYVWTPFTMLAPTAYTRSAPPRSSGGWTSTGLFFSVNCDGLRFEQTGGQYSAVSIRALDDDVDYDLRLFPEATSATSGFAVLSQLGSSSRPAGCLDVVLLREGTAASTTVDAGVINYTGATAQYVAVKENSGTIAWDTPTNVAFAQDKYLLLRQFDVPFSQTVTMQIQHDPASGPLQVAWFDQTFAQGDLLDYDAYAKTDADGFAEIVYPTIGGIQGLVIWRDPKDVGVSPAPAVTATVRVFTTPADIQPYAPPGWYAALVPRAAADGAYNSVPLPTSLPGDVDSTYLNTALRNAGPNSTPWTWTRFYVDGVQRQSSYYGPIPPNSVGTYNHLFPLTVTGGRHTVAVHFDADGASAEMSELNNNYGLQFFWTPPTVGGGNVQDRAAPPDPIAGWDDVLAAGLSVGSYNTDGLRMGAPVPLGNASWWRAVATMPGPNSDVDPRLHEKANGVLSGFNALRSQSGWGVGHSDFVLVNYRATAVREFDVGVIRRSGTEAYRSEVVSSSFLATEPSGTYGPFSLEAGRILDLIEMELPAGPVAIGLTEVYGDVDWGLSLHASDLAYQSKSRTVEEGVRWMQPRGWDEWLVLDLPAAGRYCLAVWKVGHEDLARSAGYQLLIQNEVTDVDGPAHGPLATGLRAVRPNPFNPRTTISFDVGRDGRVEVAVFNVRGERVRTLLDDTRSPGRYEVVWDGIDDRGNPVASGVYLAKLISGEVVDQRKLVLVK